MISSKTLQILQLGLMIVYKLVFELLFIPTYIHIFSYNENWRCVFDFDKWFISNILLVLFLSYQLYSFSYSKKIYEIIILFVNCICVIPLLAAYAYNSNVDSYHIVYPAMFWFVFMGACHRFAIKDDSHNTFLAIPILANQIEIILIMGLGISMIIWLWAGHPIILSLSDTTAQRMLLRAASMPSFLAYPFMIFGGTILPYMFAYCIDHKKYHYAALFLTAGILLFFTNGMKTWLFMYLFVIGIFIVDKLSKESTRYLSLFIVSTFIIITILCCYMFFSHGKVDSIAQFGRVTLIPNNIGFKSIKFFLNPEHEFLYLRESLLRGLFNTPYDGGSDFYINYGTGSTLTSSRANNGLWGDSFRNFGLLGMVIYPLLITKVFRLFEINSIHLNFRLRIALMFILLWHSVNVTFFAWLLTGGTLFLWIILKMDKYNEEQ